MISLADHFETFQLSKSLGNPLTLILDMERESKKTTLLSCQAKI
jgi:hypothetical protein